MKGNTNTVLFVLILNNLGYTELKMVVVKNKDWCHGEVTANHGIFIERVKSRSGHTGLFVIIQRQR